VPTLSSSLVWRRYKSELENAAVFINQKLESPDCALVLNLGPAWLRPDAYALFNNNVIEVPFKDWESPPGLGIVPLDVMFTVCSSMASWLQLNDEHVVVRTHKYSCSVRRKGQILVWEKRRKSVRASC
jgi:hypothetical protein